MKTVLIADDAFFMRNSLKIILEKNGYNVVGMAEDGEMAVNMIKDVAPDIVTLDLTMPKKNGIDVLKEISSYLPKTKVIVISAMGSDFLIRESILSGASNFIVKPFTEDLIINVISKL